MLEAFSLPALLQHRHEAGKLAALAAVALATWWVIGLIRDLVKWVRVGLACRPVPSAPGGNALLGHVLGLAPPNCAWDRMYDWLKQSPGGILRFRILQRTGILVGDPAAIKRIFQTRQKIYEKDLDFSYKPFLPILGTGLVTANGDYWQKMRLLMAPALRVDMLDTIIPIAKCATDRLAKRVQQYKNTKAPVDLFEEIRLLTLQVIGEAILSLNADECDRVFPHLYLPVMEESNRRVLQPWRYLFPTTVMQYNSRVRQLDGYLLDIIRTRWASRRGGRRPEKTGEKGDILDRILQNIEERGEQWSAASETQLCFEMKTFLLAGHETSSAMLAWTLYELSQDREKMLKVREEGQRVYGPNDDEPSREAMDTCVYTAAALKESLRKYSVVPVVTRNLAADDELGGYKLPKGSWIVCHIKAIHHLYKDPLAWKPDRFMPGGEYDQFSEDIRPYMFLPFIQGPRNCLGQSFALLEARVILSLLVKRFTFTTAYENAGEVSSTVIPLAPEHGMHMLVRDAHLD
ncbi:hypothetical protein N2152v2_008234 [Parachlorella kessleri]